MLEPTIRQRATPGSMQRTLHQTTWFNKLTIDPVEHRGFEYHTGVAFTIYARGVRGELGHGGRYATEANGGAGEPAAVDYDAIEAINDSRYGLQAGLFIRDISKINKAWNRLEVGGVIINDVPSFRVDHMPYGGVKDSGLGREGIRYAIEDMTEIRLLAIRDV